MRNPVAFILETGEPNSEKILVLSNDRRTAFKLVSKFMENKGSFSFSPLTIDRVVIDGEMIDSSFNLEIKDKLNATGDTERSVKRIMEV